MRHKCILSGICVWWLVAAYSWDRTSHRKRGAALNKFPPAHISDRNLLGTLQLGTYGRHEGRQEICCCECGTGQGAEKLQFGEWVARRKLQRLRYTEPRVTGRVRGDRQKINDGWRMAQPASPMQVGDRRPTRVHPKTTRLVSFPLAKAVAILYNGKNCANARGTA